MGTTIREILGNRPVHMVAPKTPMQEAARMMAEHGVGALAVVEGDRLVGILSERDIVFRGVGAAGGTGQTLVSQIMTTSPVTVDIEDPISDTLAMKLGNAFRHLPVMENGRLVGLLSYRDIPTEYVILYERFREMSGAHADE